MNIFQKFNKYSEKQGIIENPDRNGWCNARSPESSIQFDNSLLIGETQRTIPADTISAQATSTLKIFVIISKKMYYYTWIYSKNS